MNNKPTDKIVKRPAILTCDFCGWHGKKEYFVCAGRCKYCANKND